MIIFSTRIPLGMHLSVERKNTPQKQHPVRDASLTGCKGRCADSFSTDVVVLTDKCKKFPVRERISIENGYIQHIELSVRTSAIKRFDTFIHWQLLNV